MDQPDRFSLPRSIDSLRVANFVKAGSYVEHNPTRPVQGQNFPNGQIRFQHLSNSDQWIDMKNSFLRVRVKVSKANPAYPAAPEDPPVPARLPIGVDDDIAFSMLPASTLFAGLQLDLMNTTVERINKRFPEHCISYIRNKIPRSTIESLKDTLYLGDYTNRKDKTGRQTHFEFCLPLPVGLAQTDKLLPPGTDMTITLDPNRLYNTAFFETTAADEVKDPQVEIEDLRLFIRNVSGPALPSKPAVEGQPNQIILDLSCYDVREVALDSKNFSEKTLNIPPSTVAYTVAYQDTRAGVQSLFSPTEIFIRPKAGASKDNISKTISRFYTQIGVVKQPQQDLDSKDDADYKYNSSPYLTTVLNRDLGLNSENYKEWKDRGELYTFKLLRDKEDKSTQLKIGQEFTTNDDIDGSNGQLLVICEYSKVIVFTLNNGRITHISSADI